MTGKEMNSYTLNVKSSPRNILLLSALLLVFQDQKINQLSDEISRLRSIEMDSFRKDQQVQQLQQKLKELESRTKTQQPVQNGGPQLTYRVDSPHHRSQQQSPVVSGPQIQQQQQAAMGGAPVQQQGPIVMGGDPEMTAKLLQLETEVAEKKQEIEQLKEQVCDFFSLHTIY